MKSIVKEFREFITRGNVVDLAVAVVVGAAFTQVVNAFANEVVLQLVAALFGKPVFDRISYSVNGTEIHYGALLTAIVNFLIVGAAMFVVVKGLNSLQRLRRGDGDETPAEATEIDLLTEIRDALVAQQD